MKTEKPNKEKESKSEKFGEKVITLPQQMATRAQTNLEGNITKVDMELMKIMRKRQRRNDMKPVHSQYSLTAVNQDRLRIASQSSMNETNHLQIKPVLNHTYTPSFNRTGTAAFNSRHDSGITAFSAQKPPGTPSLTIGAKRNSAFQRISSLVDEQEVPNGKRPQTQQGFRQRAIKKGERNINDFQSQNSSVNKTQENNFMGETTKGDVTTMRSTFHKSQKKSSLEMKPTEMDQESKVTLQRCKTPSMNTSNKLAPHRGRNARSSMQKTHFPTQKPMPFDAISTQIDMKRRSNIANAKTTRYDLKQKFVQDKMELYNQIMEKDRAIIKTVPEDSTPYLERLPMPISIKFFETQYMGLRRKQIRRQLIADCDVQEKEEWNLKCIQKRIGDKDDKRRKLNQYEKLKCYMPVLPYQQK